MRRHDKRTREQRKADESALFAAACLGATVILIVVAILATSAQAVDASPEESSVVSEEYDSALDIPATESAVCSDVFLGEYTLTAYCACSKCCGVWANGYTATGTWATEGRTIAVDPDVIPYGSRVTLIWPDGTQHSYIAEDCGSGIQGNRIDVFFADHETARYFGVQRAMAYLEGER